MRTLPYLQEAGGVPSPGASVVIAVRDEAERQGIAVSFHDLDIIRHHAELYSEAMAEGALFLC